jgi:hypothetical protein
MTDVRARTSSGARNGLRIALHGLGLVLAALFIASCGSSTFQVGTPVVTLSAKPGRFTSYIVTITQITMTRQDGTVVGLPAINERVDLAHLSRYANLMEAPAVEVGTYVSATFALDYSSLPPYVTVDIGGQAYPTTLLDPTTGAAPISETVTVKFDPNHPLVIQNQQSSVIAFDIDLEASNLIGNPVAGVSPVTVKPFWNATTVPVYNKPVYARGLYVVADTKNNNFTMNVRALHDVVNSPFGALTVNVTDQTYYQVNGTTYVGAPGLAAVAALQNTYANLQIAAYGNGPNPFASLSTITPSFNATAVYVGTSLESTIEEQVTGIVAGISGDTLTVMGAAYVDRLGDYGFTQSIPVTVGPNTIVSQDGVAGITPALDLISVGQVVTVLGQGTANPTTFNPISMDATGTVVPGAQVRLQSTTLFGTVNSATTGSLSLNLLSVEHYEPTHLNFTGTGSNRGLDATAANYMINTGSTDESGTAAGTLLKIDGFANIFGQGPPDFNATTITPASSLPSQLILEWSSGALNPFSTVNQGAIIANLADAALSTHIVRTGPGLVPPVDVTQNLAHPKLLVINYAQGTATSPVLFGVGSVSVGEELFTDTQAYANQVLVVNNGTLPIYKLTAWGQYDANSGTFTATSITINSK